MAFKPLIMKIYGEMTKKLTYILLSLAFTVVFSASALPQDTASMPDSPDNKDNEKESSAPETGEMKTQRFEVETSDVAQADASMEDFLKDQFPIISDEAIEEILNGREYKEKIETEVIDSNTTEKVTRHLYYYEVGENYLVDTAKIMWQLNIPEFRSRIYQYYKNDTILIDTWNNVVGTINDKTYAGHFAAYKLRNWPSWKDPDPKKAHLNATPPGPKNPLGLFVVHYDENSLRYFHGTNKNHLVYNEMRNLSHGCVRNDNDNIAKMKEFIIKRVVKADDLSGWLGSKRSMTYMMEESDKFPVEIIYKTFNIDSDSFGPYIEFFKDVYNYERGNYDNSLNDGSMVTLTTKENIIEEFKKEYNKGLTVEELGLIIDGILPNKEYYTKYYFADLKEKYLTNN